MFDVYAVTDVGLVREHNEDCFLVNDFISSSDDFRMNIFNDEFLVAVCDGVGGAASGEIASKLVLEGLKEFLENTPRGEMIDSLSETITNISGRLHSFGDESPEHRGLSSTLTGLLYVEGKLVIFNVGDSRIYRYRNGYLRQMTRDHSVQRAINFTEGRFGDSGDELKVGNLLLRCMGGDKNNKPSPDIDVLKEDFEDEEIYLLCSDGLSSSVSIDAMEKIIASTSDISDICGTLINAAKENESNDNITIVMIKKMDLG